MGKKAKRAREWWVRCAGVRQPIGPMTHAEARRTAKDMASENAHPTLHRVVDGKTVTKITPRFPELTRQA